MVSALRGRCPRPLDERAVGAEPSTRQGSVPDSGPERGLRAVAGSAEAIGTIGAFRAGVAELADANDSKSFAARRVGSSPSTGTIS